MPKSASQRQYGSRMPTAHMLMSMAVAVQNLAESTGRLSGAATDNYIPLQTGDAENSFRRLMKLSGRGSGNKL